VRYAKEVLFSALRTILKIAQEMPRILEGCQHSKSGESGASIVSAESTVRRCKSTHRIRPRTICPPVRYVLFTFSARVFVAPKSCSANQQSEQKEFFLQSWHSLQIASLGTRGRDRTTFIVLLCTEYSAVCTERY